MHGMVVNPIALFRRHGPNAALPHRLKLHVGIAKAKAKCPHQPPRAPTPTTGPTLQRSVFSNDRPHIGPQEEAGSHNADGRKRHHEPRKRRRQPQLHEGVKRPGRKGYGEDVVCHGPDEVEAYAAEHDAAQVHRHHHVVEGRPDQDDVGGLDSHLGPGPYGHANVSAGQGDRVVDAIPDNRNAAGPPPSLPEPPRLSKPTPQPGARAAAETTTGVHQHGPVLAPLQPGHKVGLALRRDTRADPAILDPHLPRHSEGRHLVVTRAHPDVDAHALQRLDRRPRLGLDGIGDAQDADDTAAGAAQVGGSAIEGLRFREDGNVDADLTLSAYLGDLIVSGAVIRRLP
eukprot:CAMPEP_0183294020 /NCGR_PEP_ID=MMETSP0160_2-20130417/2502_1 /TAXON_ID=2839 ORGANISM="Odontella Sinensis, Strain Grunow 1884" /NCGR_SAMPLE_ID=MMETSP0160_2 /ASSEMBLY_ACC=CAM_ASM_000250 /LENGTH=342 /DNA_ID=CAMNT_0025455247 /DNA_START=86 /DNA_END=1110 /DNA_ORIENTATION=-